MSMEERRTVLVPVADAGRVKSLQRSAAAALRRQRLAPVGDTVDGQRYEQIQAEIDRIAFLLLSAPDDGLAIPRSDIELEVTWPFAPGDTPGVDYSADPVTVRSVWRPTDPRADRLAAVKERFERQLRHWADPAGGEAAPEPVCPSDIRNEVLSEGMRAYFEITPGSTPSPARVVYGDGSVARPLRLRSLRFDAASAGGSRQVLRLTLLSVRHMEMDATVDGAWLRNREISLRRPSGQTDDLVYEYSRDQLAVLAEDHPIEIHMFQTGLEPAIVGFYRALADHHLCGRGKAVSVFPQYYAGGSDFAPGEPWVISA